MTLAIYPGTFDPITVGHLDVVRRAARLFDRLEIVVYADSNKSGGLFSTEERIALAREAVAAEGLAGVSVSGYTGLTVDFARSIGASVIVRGLRAVSDFEFEFKLAHMNAHLAPDIEVVFLMSSARQAFVSSSLIREVASFGGDLTGLVPEHVRQALAAKFAGEPVGNPGD